MAGLGSGSMGFDLPKATLTIQDIIYGIMEHFHITAASSRRIALFPGTYVVTWHKFFYKLRQEWGGEFPELNTILERFDWDGPFPKSPEIQDALDAILRLCIPIPHENKIMLWINRPTNPLDGFPKLQDAIISSAKKHHLVDYHELPF